MTIRPRFRSRARWLRATLAASASCWIAPALAESPDVAGGDRALRLSYAADAQCPGLPELERQIRDRTSAARWAEPGEDAIEFVVHVQARADHVAAELTIERPGELPVSRRIEGADCVEVLEAVGLVIALTVDPDAATGESPPEPEPVRAPRAQRPEPERAPAPSAEPPRWRFGGGTSAVFLFGVAPGVMPGIAAMLGGHKPGTGLAPLLGLRAQYARASGFRAPAGSAAFELTSLGAVICPAQLLPGRAFALRPCLSGQYGVLEARGSETEHPRSESHHWGTLGLGTRLEWAVLPIATLQASAGVHLPLTQSRFLFGSDVFHETEPVMVSLGLGLAVWPL